MKIRVRYSLIIVAMIIVIAATLSVSLIMAFKDASREINALHDDMLSRQLIDTATRQAENVAAQLAENLANPVYFLEMDAIQDLLEIVLAHPDVDAVVVLDGNNRIIHDGKASLPSFGERVRLKQPAEERLRHGETSVQQDRDVIQIVQPIVLGSQAIGAVQLKYSLKSILDNAAELRASMQQAEREAFLSFVRFAVFTTLLLVVAGALLSLLVVQVIQNPILKLVHFAEEMGKGMFHQKVDIERSDELGQLANSLNEMAARLDERTREIQFLAFHDGLTQLPNRDYFKSSLDEAIKRAKRERLGFTLLFIDIDNFKLINDVYGHAAGDYILISLAKRIQSCLRETDLVANSMADDKHSLLGRLAGDEFIALLEGTDNKIDAAAISQRILDRVSRPFQWKNNAISLGISVGIALYPDNGNSVETLLRNADAAMYYVKKQGKNNFHFFSPELDQQAHEQLALLEDLAKAVSRNQLELWFQPQYDLVSRQLVGAEALLRWRHPTRGLLYPDSFIPLAEKSVHIYDVGAWVIRESIARLRQWQRIDPGLCVAINVSPVQLQRSGWLLEQLADVAQDPRLAAKIDLEITESFFIKAEGNAAAALSELSEKGFHIWLDDFGTGFSSLNHLKHFPVDGVKIDKTYVSEMVDHTESLSLTRAIVQVAEAFGIRVIAEGVETAEQELLLRQLGCTLAQGYLYSKPLTAGEFEDFLLAQIVPGRVS